MVRKAYNDFVQEITCMGVWMRLNQADINSVESKGGKWQKPSFWVRKRGINPYGETQQESTRHICWKETRSKT